MISVIIPTYKEPEYLDLCLHSAIEGQNNINEIIVVVDGFYELNKSVLDKYSNDIKILDLGNNKGLSVATNWGVYNATHDYILVVNDDNVFPENWDIKLEPHLSKGVVVTPNEMEPSPSMFHQKHIKNLGTSPTEFNLGNFWEYERGLFKESDNTGSTLPFAMYKYDYLAVGGWDIMYPSPHVVDWDFFLKCEYFGMEMKRIYTHFYHFCGAATRPTPEQSAESTRKEMLAHKFFHNKWDTPTEHNPINNSKLLSKFK